MYGYLILFKWQLRNIPYQQFTQHNNNPVASETALSLHILSSP
jgi:hypothetical protein